MKIMKWCIPFCALAAILVLTIFLFFAMPEKREPDSLSISEEQKELLQMDEGDKVCRIFDVPFLFAFIYSDTVDDVISQWTLNRYYYVENTSERTKMHVKEDGTIAIYSYGIVHEEHWAAMETDEITKLIGDDVKVYGTYVLFDYNDTNEFPIICYTTNKGDYVYYPVYSFLFPIKVFRAYQMANILDLRYRDYSFPVGIWEHWRVNSPEFDLDAPLHWTPTEYWKKAESAG